jgi:hypothetical protein
VPHSLASFAEKVGTERFDVEFIKAVEGTDVEPRGRKPLSVQEQAFVLAQAVAPPRAGLRLHDPGHLTTHRDKVGIRPQNTRHLNMRAYQSIAAGGSDTKIREPLQVRRMG